MIVIAIIISVVFVIILAMIIKAYYKDIIETNDRILILEKRIQQQYKNFSDTINDLKDEIINLNVERSDLEKRVGKLERKHLPKNN